jgi:hypothetical protein
MSGHHDVVVAPRPDVDIADELHNIYAPYPPLAHDRSRMTVTVTDGVVKASGNVRTAQVREIFAREAAKIDGVQRVDVDELYDDETLRRDAGHVTPFGVLAYPSYGAVVLTGKLPEDANLDEMVAAVAAIAGVRKVIPNFR